MAPTLLRAPPEQMGKVHQKLFKYFRKNPGGDTAAPVATDSDTDDSVSGSAQHRASALRASYDFEDDHRCHAGEGRTITIEFDSFILVACYVPNIGEGARRLDYRVNEW